jgi:hypothetical protein
LNLNDVLLSGNSQPKVQSKLESVYALIHHFTFTAPLTSILNLELGLDVQIHKFPHVNQLFHAVFNSTV